VPAPVTPISGAIWALNSLAGNGYTSTTNACGGGNTIDTNRILLVGSTSGTITTIAVHIQPEKQSQLILLMVCRFIMELIIILELLLIRFQD
jgi:hypothetical protein